MTKKNIVITGGNSGIGLQTAKQLYAAGYIIIFGSRSQQKNRQALQLILNYAPKSTGKIKDLELDLYKQASIEQFVKKVQKQFTVIDILINNAGLIINQRQLNQKKHRNDHGYQSLRTFLSHLPPLPSHQNFCIRQNHQRLPPLCTNKQNNPLVKILQPRTILDRSANITCLNLRMYSLLLAWHKGSLNIPTQKTFRLHPGIFDTNFATQITAFNCCKMFCCCIYSKPDAGARTTLYLSTFPFQQPQSGQYYDSDTSIEDMNPKVQIKQLLRVCGQLVKRLMEYNSRYDIIKNIQISQKQYQIQLEINLIFALGNSNIQFYTISNTKKQNNSSLFLLIDYLDSSIRVIQQIYVVNDLLKCINMDDLFNYTKSDKQIII